MASVTWQSRESAGLRDLHVMHGLAAGGETAEKSGDRRLKILTAGQTWRM